MKKHHYIIVALCVVAVSVTLWVSLSSDVSRLATQEFVIRITGTEGLHADGIVTVTNKNKTKDWAKTTIQATAGVMDIRLLPMVRIVFCE